MFVPTIGKLTADFAANDDIGEINFKELSKLAEKRKWQARFSKDYKGEMNAFTDKLFRDDIVKCYVSTSQSGQEVGYIRLVDKTSRFQPSEGDVWCLEDAYVKPAHRHMGIMRKMTEWAVKNKNVKVMHITVDRFKHNYIYFCDLGFRHFINVDETILGYLIHDSCSELLHSISQKQHKHPHTAHAHAWDFFDKNTITIKQLHIYIISKYQ